MCRYNSNFAKTEIVAAVLRHPQSGLGGILLALALILISFSHVVGAMPPFLI